MGRGCKIRTGANNVSNSSLHDEVDLKILETITDVDGTEAVGVNLVEELVAGPLQRANHNSVAALVALQRPAAAWLVLRGRLEESLIEGRRRQVELCALLLILHVAEVQVVIKFHAGLAGEATECFIAAHLVLRGHFEGADGADLAIILNRVYHCRQTVQFCISVAYKCQ